MCVGRPPSAAKRTDQKPPKQQALNAALTTSRDSRTTVVQHPAVAGEGARPTFIEMLKISQSLFDALRAHGEETYPHECCGVLLGHHEGDVRDVSSLERVGNTRTDSAHNRYNIDPRDLIRIMRESGARGLDIVGFYHSHPDHPAQWSKTDFAEAHWFESLLRHY